MKRNWSYSVPTDGIVFRIEIYLPVNRKNIIDRIIEFDKTFIALGFKYKVYNLVDEEQDINNILKTYETAKKKQYEEVSFTKTVPPNYSLSKFCLLNTPLNAGLNFEAPLLNFPFLIDEARQRRGPFNSLEEYLKRDTSGYHDILFIMPDRFLDFKTIDESGDYLSIEMTSDSDIWFDKIIIGKADGRAKWFDPPLSNRYYAYQITPNFNSFLKGLYDFIKEYDGGAIEVSTENLEHITKEITEEGYILLDGKVIFQEDIDSGKVKIPYY